MSKEKTAPVEAKQPKTVQVSVILPWIIVIVLASSVTGIIAGYFVHANMIGDARQEVASLKSDK